MKHVAENLTYSRRPACWYVLCPWCYRGVHERGMVGSAILIYLSPWQPTQYKAEILRHQEQEVFINIAQFLYLCIPQMGSITFKVKMLLTVTEEYCNRAFILFAINNIACLSNPHCGWGLLLSLPSQCLLLPILRLLHNQQIPNRLKKACPKGNPLHPARANYQPQRSRQAAITHPVDNRDFEKETAVLLQQWLELEGTFIVIYSGEAYVRKKKRNKSMAF